MGSFHWKFLSKNTILRHVTGGDLNLHNLIKNGNCLKELEPRENTAKRKQQYPYQEFDAPWTPGDQQIEMRDVHGITFGKESTRNEQDIRKM